MADDLGQRRDLRRRVGAEVLRWVRPFVALCVAACLTFLVFDVLESPPRPGDPVVVEFTRTHGLHHDDVPALWVWGIGVVLCVVLGYPRGRKQDDDPPDR